MNLNSEDYFSLSDAERRKGIRSPTPKAYSNEHTFIKDDNQIDATDQYVEELKKGSSNILVAVRLRPLWYKEIEKDEFEIVRILDQKVVILMDPADIMHDNNVLGKNRSKEKQYAFDFAFDKEASQMELFARTTKFLCDGILNGYNATVFAYGATGAGKTYTMLGTEEKPGIMFHTLKELFNKMTDYKIDRDFNIRVSFLEIYNEQIRDLIMVSSDVLDLREDPVKGVCVAGLSEIEVDTPEEVLDLLIFGNRNRTQEATGANETSSRSHAVLQIICEHKDKDAGIEAEVRIGKLSLIDLAGSERASKTNNRGIRMIEGANINRSLLALGNCINMLHENNSKNQTNYIPFRDSKLTRLLKDSLGGNCRTVMIANISPSNACYEDTHNTLKYANRAKNIKTNVQRNVLNVEYHVSKYTQIISQLKGEITELKTQLKNQGGGNGGQGIVAIPRDPPINFAELEKSKEDLNNHFVEEIKVKKRVHELEQKMETAALSIISKRNELSSLLKDKGKDHIQVKIINEEIDETNNQIKELKQQLESNNQKMMILLKRREGFSNEWKQSGHKEIAIDLLNHIMRENIILVENLEYSRKDQKTDLQLKIKEIQMNKLQEQIKVRDEMLSNAKRRYQVEGMEFDLEDPRVIQLEELIGNASIFPPIDNRSMGKATGQLIKSLLNNFSDSKNNNQGNQRRQNAVYHSLPPIGPGREQSESKIPRPKNILTSVDNERNKLNINFKDNKDNAAAKRGQQLSINSRVGNYPVTKNEGQLSSKNIYNAYSGIAVNSQQQQQQQQQQPQQQQQLSNVNSGMLSNFTKQQNINSIKQQINFASNFAKNLQFKSNLKKPTLVGRNDSSNKKTLLPSPTQHMLQQEERKRSNSVVSSGSIISTASSNSPKLGGDKRKQHNSLQIAGMKLGSQRKSYIPSKYDKNSYIKQEINTAATDQLKSSNQKNIALSIAARKKEMQVQADHSAQVIEKNKRKVLDALNKNYRKKQY